MINLKAIKERCEKLKMMNESPALDSFDQELVCNCADDLPQLVEWVERAMPMLRDYATVLENSSWEGYGKIPADVEQLLREVE